MNNLDINQFAFECLTGTNCRLLPENLCAENLDTVPFPGIPDTAIWQHSLSDPSSVRLPDSLTGCTLALLVDIENDDFTSHPNQDPLNKLVILNGQRYLVRDEIMNMEDFLALFDESIVYYHRLAFVVKDISLIYETIPQKFVFSAYDDEGFLLSVVKKN